MLSSWFVPPHVRYLARILSGKESRARRMHFLRSVVGWCVPANVQSAVLSAAYDVARFGVSNNAELKGRHAGERRCFVIGNGPSLKRMELAPLAREVTIGCNSFYKHPQAEAVGLDYLCIGDTSFYSDEARTREWHRTIEAQMPDTTLLLHPDGKKLIDAGIYRNHDVYYYRPGITTNYADLVQFDLTQPTNVGHCTGTKLAIPLAIYLGFEEIYLIGFDCNWLENYKASYHFYDEHELWPEFDSQQADQRWPKYEDQLVNALRDFKSHDMLFERAKQLGIRIFNASSEGLLDMYPRVPYASLFER